MQHNLNQSYLCCIVQGGQGKGSIRPNFLCLLHLSDAHFSSKNVGRCSKCKKNVQYKLKHLFGAEMRVDEMQQAAKI
jgi:hypothetical protein